MVEGFISDMLPKSSYLEAPTIVKNINETTDGDEIRDLMLKYLVAEYMIRSMSYYDNRQRSSTEIMLILIVTFD